jgi:Fur family peroxide stress response transcriptional regulator
MDKTQQKNSIDAFISRCREVKLSVTPQRLSIYKALIEDKTHPSPEMIFRKIKPNHPTISLATVYKTLETFQKNNIISLVTAVHNTVRYDPLTHRHHHMICQRCKKVVDLEEPALNDLDIPQAVMRHNRFLDYSVHFNVICSDCLKAEN